MPTLTTDHDYAEHNATMALRTALRSEPNLPPPLQRAVRDRAYAAGIQARQLHNGTPLPTA